MIRLLAISGSPVLASSTEILLRHVMRCVADELRPGLDIVEKFVRLNDLTFRPCQSCGEAPTPDFCLYDDDLTAVYRDLADCDCLLFGSPLYFDSVSAQAKMFIDRCNCLRPPDFKGENPDHDFIPLVTRRRPGLMVFVGGERGWFEGARRVVAGFFKWVEVHGEGVLVYHSRDYNEAGTVATDHAVLAEATAQGRKLAATIRKDHVP